MQALYFFIFSGAFTAIFISTIERGEKKYGLSGGGIGLLRSLNIAITAAFMFSFVSLGNAALGFALRPAAFVLLQVLAIAGLFAFAGFMELRYREEARLNWQEMIEEMTALRKGLEKDPENAAYLERLEELYEKTGDMKAASASLERLAALYRKTCNMRAAEICAGKARKLDPENPDRGEGEPLKGPPRPDPAVSPFFAVAAGYFRFLADLLKSAGRILKARGSK